MAQDRFENFVDSPMAPAERCFAIVPSDTADLSSVTKALYVGQGGDVALIASRSGASVVFRNLNAGTVLDVRCSRILATGTTAAHLVGLA